MTGKTLSSHERQKSREAHQEPATKRQNKGKLLSSSQAAGVIIDILEHRVEHNEICERIRRSVPAPAPAQHVTVSEYPFGGDMSQANKPIYTYYEADLHTSTLVYMNDDTIESVEFLAQIGIDSIREDQYQVYGGMLGASGQSEIDQDER